MARVTVEDCILKIPNRFKLVMMAAQRSRALSVGTPLTIDRDNDKNPVVALREIADGKVPVEELEEGLVRGLQKHVDVDEPVDDTAELLAMEETLGGLAGAGVAEAFGAPNDADAAEAEAEDEGEDLDEEEPKGEAGAEPRPETDEED